MTHAKASEAGRVRRKLSEARLSKILREMNKQEVPNIEYCDLKQQSEREELEELLRIERAAPERTIP